MRRLSAVLALALLPTGAAAADPVPGVKETISRGLNFLAKDNLAWKQKRQCAECHHAPFTLWALNEGKKRGHAVDEKALGDLTSWALSKDHLARLVARPAKREQVELIQAPLMLALGVEAGDARANQAALKVMLNSVLADQSKDGSWRLSSEFRPIGSSPEVLTALALLALSAPSSPDLGKEGKVARERGLAWLRAARPDDEVQSAALRLILWRRLGRPAAEWAPLVKKLRAAQNGDGGWGQISKAKSDAYATGQALYALAEAGAGPGDEAVRRGQAFLVKAQRKDGAWAMVSRAIMRDGKPPRNLEPITHAGSAWAVLGLVRSAPAVARPRGTVAR
jgi:squalene-hopene/tetraprenyl-beta-curcumene cyclase